MRREGRGGQKKRGRRGGGKEQGSEIGTDSDKDVSRGVSVGSKSKLALRKKGGRGMWV